MNNPLVEELCRTAQRYKGDVTDELNTLGNITKDLISMYCRYYGQKPNAIFMGIEVYRLILLDRRLFWARRMQKTDTGYDSYGGLKVIIVQEYYAFFVGHILEETK